MLELNDFFNSTGMLEHKFGEVIIPGEMHESISATIKTWTLQIKKKNLSNLIGTF